MPVALAGRRHRRCIKHSDAIACSLPVYGYELNDEIKSHQTLKRDSTFFTSATFLQDIPTVTRHQTLRRDNTFFTSYKTVWSGLSPILYQTLRRDSTFFTRGIEVLASRGLFVHQTLRRDSTLFTRKCGYGAGFADG